jgi:anti-sigma B factor antagonist
LRVVQPDLFTLEVRPEGDLTVVVVTGELDIATAPRIRDTVSRLRADGCDAMVLDLRELTFVDSQGLALLVQLDREARTQAWDFAIADGSPPLSRLLKIVGLEDHFERRALA